MPKFLDRPAKGEANTPDGFRSQTPNGTGLSEGPGWNRQQNYDAPQAPATGPWNNRGNRSAE
jgi:hypothetical protein